MGSVRVGYDGGFVIAGPRQLNLESFEFADRSVASSFFDVNRSLAWGLYGERNDWNRPWDWELAVFNGLVTGGAETGSSGALDNNFAYSGSTPARRPLINCSENIRVRHRGM